MSFITCQSTLFSVALSFEGIWSDAMLMISSSRSRPIADFDRCQQFLRNSFQSLIYDPNRRQDMRKAITDRRVGLPNQGSSFTPPGTVIWCRRELIHKLNSALGTARGGVLSVQLSAE